MPFLPRDHYLKEIQKLDPVQDHERIAFISTCCEFPWDTSRALELALFRTFAIAKGTLLLESTGELTLRTQKRYDDTVLILAEILENGYNSPRGRAALRRMNQIHRRYPIPNDEYLYVLSTFTFEPIRWNLLFGWRPLTEQERLASFYYWRQIGCFMNIQDIPADFETFESFNREYESEHFRYARSNHQLARAARDLFLSWYLPPPLRSLGAPLIHAFLDDPLLDAVGFPRPSGRARQVVRAALRLRGLILRSLPARRRPRLYTRTPQRTYPHGYRIEELGPPAGHGES